MPTQIAASCLFACLTLVPTQISWAQTEQGLQSIPDDVESQLVVPNDNRHAAGSLRNGIVELHLDARQAIWRPDIDAENSVNVLAFAEEGGEARIPGPLLRVPQGTDVRVTVRNSVPDAFPIGIPPPNRHEEGMSSSAGPELIVHGLRAGTVPDDILIIPRGEVREVRFRADMPGTFFYWAETTKRGMRSRTGPDAQLTGAIVVDRVDKTPDAGERIFVITMTDSFPDPTQSPSGEDMFELAINGLSWPHTERAKYRTGDTVRWRWINGTGFEHPMHLHGFHFRTLARGDGISETIYAADVTQDVVTELMEPGSTIRMEWTPTRKGNWLMHCHIIDHIIPDPPRDQDARAHDMHDVTEHALRAMAGLVLGITVSDAQPEEKDRRPQHHIRLLAQQKRAAEADATIRGFIIEEGSAPPRDEVMVPGPPVVLTRGETTNITVVNNMLEPTTVHWHGLELQSVYDGVAGLSRSGSRVAPLVGPGDEFEVFIRPPRAGTFIYHSHMDETQQLTSGMYGPLLVMAPGQEFDPVVDRVFVLGDAVDGSYHSLTINGRRDPAPITLQVGTEYRLRFIDMTPGSTVDISASAGAESIRWRALAKDGADLPPALQTEDIVQFRMGTGETYDFTWTPTESVKAAIVVDWTFATEPGHRILRQPIHVE